MSEFNKYFLMSETDVPDYVRFKIPDFFDTSSELQCQEIGDGNLNYVFRVSEKNSDKTIIVKQAAEELRISKEMHASTDRGRIEARILDIQNKYAPGFVPKVYSYDSTMCAIIMQDMIGHSMMRTALIKHEIFPKFAEQIADFLANTLLLTSDICMNHKEKERLTAEFVNPDLCEITHDLVYTEPFINDKTRNDILPCNEEFIKKHIYDDRQLHLEAAKLKFDFLTNTQALIHGDLHTGSVFINKEHMYVFDPEFAFYGPIGYDIGNIIANLNFALINGYFTHVEGAKNDDFISWVKQCIKDIIDLFIKKYNSVYDLNVTDKMAVIPGFKEYYLSNILVQTSGVAGLEIIRRIVGIAHVKDITCITDVEKRAHAERILVMASKEFILHPEIFDDGKSYISCIEKMINEIK